MVKQLNLGSWTQNFEIFFSVFIGKFSGDKIAPLNKSAKERKSER